MVLNTRRLFARLLQEMQITTVCDVGSMNGDDALAFRAALPHATVFAFEANPENVRLMQARTRLQHEKIHIVPFAVTNYDGEAPFFLVGADYSTVNDARGQSSLYRRSEQSGASAAILVKATRLDTFLGGQHMPHAHIALWIDVEGKAYEVFEGAVGIVQDVKLIHVEVETEPCIASSQRLYSETKALLRDFGFAELATDAPRSWDQFNALFVRRALSPGLMVQVARRIAGGRLRFLAGSTIRQTRALGRKVCGPLIG